jgi:hypothetical protein
MRGLTLVTALALLVLPVATPPALAAEPLGRPCAFTSATDPQVEGSQTGGLVGGPLLVTGDDGLPAEADLFCTVQVNSPTHAGADSVMCETDGTAVVVLGCTATYATQTGDNVYLCTAVWLYWHGHIGWYWDADSSTWSTDPNVPCALATSLQTPDLGEVDPLVCPVLALVFPPEGDIGVPVAGKIWDCPPYD